MALTKITPQMFDTSAAGHDFNIDNGTFVVDASANRVGIGTPTPSTLLHVNGALTAGTINASGSIVATQGGNLAELSYLGALELVRSASNAFIDFKTTTSEDYDCRIQQDSNGLIFVTGGQGSIATALTLNSSQNATFAGNINVTGDIDASGLLKVGTNNTEYANNYLRFKSSGAGYFDHNTTGQHIYFRTSVSSALDTTPLQVGGDGYVYIRGLRLNGADGSVNQIWQSTSNAMLGISANGGDINLGQTSSSTMRLKPSGNVGIGEESPDGRLHVRGGSSAGGQIWIQTDGTFAGTDEAQLNFRHYDDTGAAGAQIKLIGTTNYTGDMVFSVRGGGTSGAGGATLIERMRINSAGDWMVSNTVANVASNYSAQGGCGWVESDNHFEIATTSNRSALEIGKNNANDGAIINFRKQSTIFGSIGTNGGRLSIGSGDVNLNFNASANSIYPISDTAGNLSDGSVDLGASSARFKDLYLSGKANVGGTSVSQSIIQMVANSTNGANTIHFGDATSGAASYVGYINYAHDSNSMQFSTSGTVRMSIDSSGDVTMSNQPYAHGVITGNITSITTNYGIALTTHSSRNCTPQTNSTHGPGITITKAGFYIMNAIFLQDPVGTYVYVGWCVNGSMVHHWHSNHTVSNHDAHSSIGKYLNVGDHVTIEKTTANNISTIYGNTHSAWWICKIG